MNDNGRRGRAGGRLYGQAALVSSGRTLAPTLNAAFSSQVAPFTGDGALPEPELGPDPAGGDPVRGRPRTGRLIVRSGCLQPAAATVTTVAATLDPPAQCQSLIGTSRGAGAPSPVSISDLRLIR